MENAVGYEQRRRIRAQIRIVKKLISERKIPEKKVTKTSSSTKQSYQTITKKPSSRQVKEPESQISQEVALRNSYNKGTVTQTMKAQTGEAKYSQVETYDDRQVIKTKRFQSKTIISGEEKYATYKKSSPTFTQKELLDSDKVKGTDIITSSYGIGPTDENGLPLFGIRALRKAGREKVHGKE